MNYDTYDKLKLKLNNLNISTLKGATGHDMFTKGISTYDFTIN